jgi:hypothetical protein
LGFDTHSAAFIWDQAHGIRELQHVLATEFGLAAALEGWQLTRANDISADGRVIVGEGINPDGTLEAWLAIIPEPSTLTLAIAALALPFAGCRRLRIISVPAEVIVRANGRPPVYPRLSNPPR